MGFGLVGVSITIVVLAEVSWQVSVAKDSTNSL
jgi:hypothetical protein